MKKVINLFYFLIGTFILFVLTMGIEELAITVLKKTGINVIPFFVDNIIIFVALNLVVALIMTYKLYDFKKVFDRHISQDE